MKNSCKCALRDYISHCLAQTRQAGQYSQEKFSELHMMNPRSYADPEHGQFLCCTLTFVLFLVFYCEDANVILQDMKRIILNACKGGFPLP